MNRRSHGLLDGREHLLQGRVTTNNATAGRGYCGKGAAIHARGRPQCHWARGARERRPADSGAPKSRINRQQARQKCMVIAGEQRWHQTH
jgi:hypothetical protein